MRKKHKLLLVLFAFILAFSSMAVHAKTYYSPKQLKLDYSKGVYGTFGAGKNGYKFVHIVKVKNNRIYYKLTKTVAAKYAPFDFKDIGKLKSAKLTNKTKYYYGDASKYFQSHISGGIHSKAAKKCKSIYLVDKKTYSSGYIKYWTFIKVKNGKVQTVISNMMYGN